MSAPAAGRPEIPPGARVAQARASDPRASAWVSANAGSGKTHVLAQRVLRLLLGGAPPSRILCLTFTKAAAANMADRVFKTLARWTQLSDDALRAAIVEVGAGTPDAARLSFARRLFARTIETPGGLKIQTIHAFCERLLHLFPFEANVAAGFRVVEERDAALLLERARAEALTAAVRNVEGEQRLAAVAREAGADGFDKLLREALGLRAEIVESMAFCGDSTGYGEALAERLGLEPGEDVATLESAMLTGLGGRANWVNIAVQFDQGSKKDNDLAAALREAVDASDREFTLKSYLSVFFTKADEPRGGGDRKLITKPLEARFPGLLARLQAEQERLIALREKLKAAQTLARSLILIELAAAILSAYARQKAQRGLLDFDDLIERTLSLLSRSDAAWVLYKLDSGIDHILVDEAQDTSKEQWEILKRLAEDFTSGKGAREIIRTFFAVGDEKQSIYSFQGAAPKMFAEMRREFAMRHKRAELDFAEVPLHLSFRSAATVLEGVDKTFSVAQTWRGMAADEEKAPPHIAFRSALPGLVEVWEPIEGTSEAVPDNWLMPIDAPSSQDPAVQLAQRIASVIGGWLSPGSHERVHDARSGGSRPIAPGDIMILVRSRGAFFEAMIRALKEADVKAAGADRLALGEHIATMDLVAVGRAALSPDDDLALACVLKSPLIGLGDTDLIALAPLREGSLTQALAEASDERFAQTHRRLEIWRERARHLSPFAFYARLLSEDGGRRAILSRLGPEAGDAIDEFLSLALAFEQSNAPSLLNFLQEIEGADVSVKRDMEASGDSVRVMTIHAAKGLEASIVFLPDTCGGPSGRHDPKLFTLDAINPGDPPLIAWSPREASDPSGVAQARAVVREAAAGEHRRLLYVAMTRAAERLVIAGFHGPRGKARDCWYDMARAGLDGAMNPSPSPWSGDEQIWRLGHASVATGGLRAETVSDREPAPPWLRVRATPERAPTALNPSRAAVAPSTMVIGPARKSRLEAGRLSHSLLQYLPDIAAEQRRDAAMRFLARRGLETPVEEYRAIIERVLSVIEDERLVSLFGVNSRAEVAIAANTPRPGSASAPFAGRIDRIAIDEEGVLIADFKSGAPHGPTSPQYLAQLALYRAALAPLYPKRPLRAFLVWLDNPDIMEIDPGALDQALAKLLTTI
ncbi:double-strand break repair helicase AddA [Methylocapsa sp. S129]|uniref:double-strand break repair helicase AddA n=1 Tax=Methylocapsa sp. S129 TaxID=1641869 RepID=UPI00131B13DF|nr:double-strand break repair helicase AddA [Methylocapsa sp. S129]